jgi:hypothetical protein
MLSSSLRWLFLFRFASGVPADNKLELLDRACVSVEFDYQDADQIVELKIKE